LRRRLGRHAVSIIPRRVGLSSRYSVMGKAAFAVHSNMMWSWVPDSKRLR